MLKTLTNYSYIHTICVMSLCFVNLLWMLIVTFISTQEKLPPTDSRLRPDQRYLENGEYEKANSEKLRLEQRQRQVPFMF